MSEYQYYQFNKLEGVLTKSELSKLEELSGHAEISATQYSVEYNWGDFPEEPETLVKQFFDIGFYYASWGDVNISIKLPANTIDSQILAATGSDIFTVVERERYQLLVFSIAEAEDYIDQAEAMELCDAVYQLRDELLQGDYRLIYLAWLYRLVFWEEAARIPLINFDFKKLSKPQKHYARVFPVPEEYIRTLALLLERRPSQDSKAPLDNASLITRLSVEDKDKILTELFEAGKVSRSFAISLLSKTSEVDALNVEYWLSKEALLSYLEEAKQILAEEKAIATAAKRKKQQAAREKKLRSIYNNRQSLWRSADDEAEAGSGHSYDRAFDLVQELADAYVFQNEKPAFLTRYDKYTQQHNGRPALMKRLKKLNVQ